MPSRLRPVRPPIRGGQFRNLSYDEAAIRSLMRHTSWSTARTNIRLFVLPMVFGGVMLMVRHDGKELAHLAAGHPDYLPN